MNLIIIKGTEISLSTSANTVGNTMCVRIVALGAATLITHSDPVAGVNVGTFTVTNTIPHFIRKNKVTDTFQTNTGTVLATPVGFGT
jgi:hypothetical protein